MLGGSTVSGATVVTLVGCALLVLGTGRPAPLTASRDTAPRAVVACAVQNQGTLYQGEVREVCFRVRNAGGRRLVIIDANAGCCGQAVEYVQFMVIPGDLVEIPVQVDTSGWCGQMREVYSYTTNDPQQPQLKLAVLGEVSVPQPGAGSVVRHGAGIASEVRAARRIPKKGKRPPLPRAESVVRKESGYLE